MIRSFPRIFQVVLVGIVLIGGVLGTVGSMVAEPPGTASPSGSPPSEPLADQAGQLYELRIYTAAPGKMEALHRRFRDHTLRLFQKHGIKSIGYWTEADAQDVDRLYYLVAYPDRTSREKMLIQGIAVDPEFRQAVAESEKEGKLTTQIESILLNPTDYSALK